MSSTTVYEEKTLNRGISKESREKAIAKVPANALPYCKIKRHDGNFLGGWDFNMCQTPELNIAKRYENAKSHIIRSYFGGLKHPHFTESYYILAHNVKAGDFR